MPWRICNARARRGAVPALPRAPARDLSVDAPTCRAQKLLPRNRLRRAPVLVRRRRPRPPPSARRVADRRSSPTHGAVKSFGTPPASRDRARPRDASRSRRGGSRAPRERGLQRTASPPRPPESSHRSSACGSRIQVVDKHRGEEAKAGRYRRRRVEKGRRRASSWARRCRRVRADPVQESMRWGDRGRRVSGGRCRASSRCRRGPDRTSRSRSEENGKSRGIAFCRPTGR